MGRISKGTKCSCNNCELDAIRSVNIAKAKNAGLDVEGIKRAYLCKDHYKEFKKGNKKDAQIEKWRHGIS
ncbi:MAG: hypothetical protein NWE89_12995 [Candidatus Bathyarchaeota archaeon]|nr:hypothetical protein [Candidatus Bathyarchaeota archaeon]